MPECDQLRSTVRKKNCSDLTVGTHVANFKNRKSGRKEKKLEKKEKNNSSKIILEEFVPYKPPSTE